MSLVHVELGHLDPYGLEELDVVTQFVDLAAGGTERVETVELIWYWRYPDGMPAVYWLTPELATLFRQARDGRTK